MGVRGRKREVEGRWERGGGVDGGKGGMRSEYVALSLCVECDILECVCLSTNIALN